jgi:hypothetical protein
MAKFWSLLGKGLVRGAIWAVGHPEVLQVVAQIAASAADGKKAS